MDRGAMKETIMATATPEVQLDHEQLAADGARVRDLFTGATALLHGDCAPSAVHAARSTLLEARALVASLVEHLEGLAARRAEAERAERAHKAEAQRVAGSVR
jgi:hypothetical protein